jgi:thioredoxin-related protein
MYPVHHQKKSFNPFFYLIGIFIFIFGLSCSYALEFIVDNDDSTHCIPDPTLSWVTSDYGKPYGINKFYTPKGDGSKTVTWTTKLPFGKYQVKAWINTAAYASDAHYLVIHSGITTSIIRNQNMAPGDWCIDLGTFEFDTVGTVILTNYWVGPELYVVADAIKFIDVSTVSSMGISWNTSSPTDALSLATTQEKPVLLYFSTEKSVDCQRLSNETFIDPTLVKWMDKFISSHIIAEENPDPMRVYNVYQVPTIIIIDSNGREKKRILGYISANDLIKELNIQLGIMGK